MMIPYTASAETSGVSPGGVFHVMALSDLYRCEVVLHLDSSKVHGECKF